MSEFIFQLQLDSTCFEDRQKELSGSLEKLRDFIPTVISSVFQMIGSLEELGEKKNLDLPVGSFTLAQEETLQVSR